MKILTTALFAGIIAATSGTAFANSNYSDPTALPTTAGEYLHSSYNDHSSSLVRDTRSFVVEGRSASADSQFSRSEITGRGSSLVRHGGGVFDGRSASSNLDRSAGDYLSGDSRF